LGAYSRARHRLAHLRVSTRDHAQFRGGFVSYRKPIAGKCLFFYSRCTLVRGAVQQLAQRDSTGLPNARFQSGLLSSAAQAAGSPKSLNHPRRTQFRGLSYSRAGERRPACAGAYPSPARFQAVPSRAGAYSHARHRRLAQLRVNHVPGLVSAPKGRVASQSWFLPLPMGPRGVEVVDSDVTAQVCRILVPSRSKTHQKYGRPTQTKKYLRYVNFGRIREINSSFYSP
jgi:hypothetical protein